MTSEQSLLSKAARFDTDGLAEIYDSFSPGIYRYAFRLLGDECLAEDCLAETFSRFLSALKHGAGPKKHLKAYLYRIAHNYITDYYRRSEPESIQVSDDLADEQPELSQSVSERLEQSRIRQALRDLTGDQRQVVILKYLEGWDNQSVAVAVGKPVSAVKSLQHRALASLRRMLDMEKERQ